MGRLDRETAGALGGGLGGAIGGGIASATSFGAVHVGMVAAAGAVAAYATHYLVEWVGRRRGTHDGD